MTEGRGDGATAEECSAICTTWGASRVWSSLGSPGPAPSTLEAAPDPPGSTRGEGRDLSARSTREVGHCLPSTCRVKASEVETTSNNPDPESLQDGAAAPHGRDSKATFPLLGEARGKNSAFNKIGLRHGRGPQAPPSKV